MINADPQELAKFSELAHRWWDPESEFRPLHQINPLRLEWIDGLVGLKGKRALDVGCGGGILADAMARKGADVLGIDLPLAALVALVCLPVFRSDQMVTRREGGFFVAAYIAYLSSLLLLRA